jgi:hypothetical protein
MYLELAWSLPPWKDKIIKDKFQKENDEYCNSRVGSTHQVTSTELTIWFEKIDVVTADKVLCHSNNRASKTLLIMVVTRVLRHVAYELANFNFFDQLFL